MVIRVTLLCAILLALLVTGTVQKADSVKERKFQFTYTATLQVPSGATSAALWLPVPKSDAYQDITELNIKSDYPIGITTDPEYGNSILYIFTSKPQPGPITVEYTFKAVRREHVNRPGDTVKVSNDDGANDPLMARWLQSDKLVPLNERVRSLAREVTKGKTTDVEKLRAIYDYAVSNLKYDKTGTGWGQGNIFFACDEKRGNCTDFHALVTGLCRASGIPAAFEMGFPIPADKPEGQIMGYHCWVKAYIKGVGWVPIDASEASKNPDKREYFFGAHDANRIQFSVGRDVPLCPDSSQCESVNFFIYPYAEINKEKFEQIEKKFTFKAL